MWTTSTPRIKQYHKEGRALRTETTINDTRDFQIGKRLTNLPALREIGFSANRRLLRLERLSHDPISGAEALAAVTGPARTPAGTRIPGLPLAQARSHALLAALLIFRLLAPRLHQPRPARPHRRTTRPARRHHRADHLRPAPAPQPPAYRPHPRTHRYQVTDTGLHTAMFLTRVHDRILPAGLAQLTSASTPPGKLRAAAAAYQAAIDDIIRDAGLAA